MTTNDVLVLELGGYNEPLRQSLLRFGRPGVKAPAPPPQRPREPEFYTEYLQKGETRYGLAAAHLGSGSRWRELLGLNGWTEEQATHLQVGTAVKFPIQ